MLLVDLRGGLMLLNEARCRTVERVFGVQRDHVNMTTVIALLVAEALRQRSERYKPSRRSNLSDWAIGADRRPSPRLSPAASADDTPPRAVEVDERVTPRAWPRRAESEPR
jgi:hypothetical protein